MTRTPDIDRQPRRPIRLMLIEDDPVFRLGLATALERVADLRVIFEADSSSTALRVLHDWLGSSTAAVETSGTEAIAPDLVILSLDLGQTSTGQGNGLVLCQQLRQSYPELPLLLISANPDPLQLATALQAGVGDYCPKGASIPELITAIRRVIRGKTSWDSAMETITRALSQQPSSTPASPALPLSRELSPPSPSVGVLAGVRRNLRQSALRQIEATIAQINAQLQSPNLSLLDELVLTGRRRELYAARWIVNQILTNRGERTNRPIADEIQRTSVSDRRSEATISSPPPPSSPSTPILPPSSPPLTLSPSPPTSLRSLQAALFDGTAALMQANLYNLTDSPLEIDILKEEKKRELLLIILRKLEDILDDLRFSQVALEQLPEKQGIVLHDLWQATTIEFFGRYATLQLNDRPVEMVDVLLQDAEVVQISILSKIPLVAEFLAHLLFQMPLTIDDRSYATGTVEAMLRMEQLLQNLIVQIANAVMQPLLNRFGNVESVKRNFYDKRLLSTREVERFRNNLSWRYRVEKYFSEPTAIFESRHNLLTLTAGGIAQESIYAPRTEELADLAGIPLAVTLALEARDAISPRLRSAISFFGSGVVYLLTDVIGRGIGLIGRGIVKGIGNALQDVRFSRK